VSRTLRVFYRVKPDILDQCKVNPSFCEDVLAGDEDGLVETFDIEQSWDAVHFAVSPNRAFPDQGELDEYLVYDWAITGADAVHAGLSLGHGPARFLTPEQARDVAQALEGVNEQECKEAFDLEAMETAEVHPDVTHLGKKAWSFVWDHVVRLREFYRRAASDGHAVITWIIPVDAS
jgi:hypothetical protein